MKITTSVTGIREVANAIHILDPEVQKRLRVVVDQSARETVAGAKSRVPVRSHELQNTIRYDKSSDGLVAFVKAGYGTLKRRSRAKTSSKRRRRAQKLGPIEPGIYAMVEEFGSQTHEAHPYLFPSLEQVRPGHVARADHALHDAVAVAERSS